MTIKPHQLDENLILAESQALLRQGRDVAASNLLEELLEAYPHSAKGLRALAQIRMLQKRPQDAVPLLKRALEIITNPASATVQIYNESFGDEDAEYIEQEHTRQADRREYDLFAETAIQHKETAFPSLPPAVAGFGALNDLDLNGGESEDLFAERTDQLPQVEPSLTDATYSASDTQNLDTTVEEQTSPADEAETYNHSDSEGTAKLHDEVIIAVTNDLTVNDLLADENYFVEQAISQEIESIHDAEFELELGINADADDISVAIEDEDDEWETLVVVDGLDEESIWEGATDHAAIDLPPTQRDFSEIPDRLTRAERALQVAMTVGDEFGWDRKGIKLLAIIFGRYWWSASQVAIRREIAAGMTPQELMLAEDVRQIWYQHPEFWSASGAFGEIVQRYTLISWPTALSLIRSFKGYPQAEEVESLLISCFERWQDSVRLQHRFPGFYSFALYCVGSYGDLPEHDGWVVFDTYSTEESDFGNAAYVERQLEHYGVHIDLHRNAFNRVIWEETDVPNKSLPSAINEAIEAHENSTEDEEEPC